ncbi:pheST operon leader peptide PheM [Escherichia coli]|nr:pheST operon leader peptide PheM [Escherichia albertii]EGG1131858.1 pheST operon leader peptide PheM [Escherichia coli]
MNAAIFLFFFYFST